MYSIHLHVVKYKSPLRAWLLPLWHTKLQWQISHTSSFELSRGEENQCAGKEPELGCAGRPSMRLPSQLRSGCTASASHAPFHTSLLPT